ncbi:hypothetical protein JTB14_023536 [Gonioctena quinquepunctata]|nr:hypothetical protein JTB14_023536 [Gonioctena quinquepunctata]
MHLLFRRLKFQWIRKFVRVIAQQQCVHSSVIQHLTKSKSDYLKKLIQNLGHQKLMSSASTYENLISQTKFCTKAEEEEEPKKSSLPCGRHEFHRETEDIINRQVTEEFKAAFSYLSIACYFGRSEIALPGCQGYFMNMYTEELTHALVLANYLLMRGGYVVLSPIDVPEDQDWKSISNAFVVALEMEKMVKERLSEVFDVAENHKDLQVMDLISTQFAEEQNKSICELSRLTVKAKMTEDPVGEYLFDKMMYDSFVKKAKGKNLMYTCKLETDESDGVYK